jgi:hypothetical protein
MRVVEVQSFLSETQDQLTKYVVVIKDDQTGSVEQVMTFTNKDEADHHAEHIRQQIIGGG